MPFGRSREPDDNMGPAYLRAAPPMSRADNISICCAQQAAGLEVAQGAQFGMPLTVSALTPASDLVRTAMSQDRDLSAWIARKSAVMLHAVVAGGMPGTPEENIDNAFGAAGLRIGAEIALLDENGAVSQDESDGARGLGAACLALLKIASSTPAEWSAADRRFYANLYTAEDGSDVEGLAYELIAWMSVVVARLNHRGLVSAQMPVFNPAFRRVPELTRAGWYPNPPRFGDTSSGDAQFQRYWDGQWTSRVRIKQGRGWTPERTLSLHDPPTD